MRMAISNLAWKAESTEQALTMLKAAGADGIEAAPTRIAPWEGLTRDALLAYRNRVEAAGLTVSSLQAILFAKPDARLLDDSASFDEMVTHLKRVADMADTLGAGVMVFGAPRNRLRGALAEETALALARDRFRALGDALTGRPLVLGIEPVPANYGGDFLTSAQSVVSLVHAVDHPHIRVHLDTGCVKLGGDSIALAIAAAGNLLCHFHASEPKLASFEQPVADHEAAAKALHATGYGGWVAIEMLEAPADALRAAESAVRWVRRTYGSA